MIRTYIRTRSVHPIDSSTTRFDWNEQVLFEMSRILAYGLRTVHI